MAEYTAHLACQPFISAEEFVTTVKEADGMEVDDPRVLDAIDDASLIMHYLTARTFGGPCTATTRPPCHAGGCRCGCSPYQVDLGYWPVIELNSVRYEGVVYEDEELADTFHINGYKYLARNDGEPFVSGNQWAIAGSAEDTEDNGYVFEVSLTYGMAVPRLITRAAKALAAELLAACCGKPCKLPQRTTSVSRQGVSMDVASATDLLRDGRTGIYEVDLAIQVFNPAGIQSPAFLFMAQKPYGHKVNT